MHVRWNPKHFPLTRFLSTTYKNRKSKPKFTFATHWPLPAGKSSLAHCRKEWTEFGERWKKISDIPCTEKPVPYTLGTCSALAQYEELLSLWMLPFFLLEDYYDCLLLAIKGMEQLTLEFHCIITPFHQKNGTSSNVKLQISELYCICDNGLFHYLAGSILKNNT